MTRCILQTKYRSTHLWVPLPFDTWISDANLALNGNPRS